MVDFFRTESENDQRFALIKMPNQPGQRRSLTIIISLSKYFTLPVRRRMALSGAVLNDTSLCFNHKVTVGFSTGR